MSGTFIIAALIMLSWPLSEVVIALTRRARARQDKVCKGGSARVVWAVALPFTVGAISMRYIGLWPMPFDGDLLVLFASIVVALGAVIRLRAILKLGSNFTVNVAVRSDHSLVKTGPYRSVRHPAYTGLLLSFFGTGMATGSWVGLILATIPVAAVLLYRINVEEKMLLSHFGEEYRQYSQETARLIPKIY